MCLAIPAQILEIDAATDNAIVSLGGVRKPVSLALVEGVVVGDYVLVHVGYALNRISPEEAESTLALMQQAGARDLPGFESGPDTTPQTQTQTQTDTVPKAGADANLKAGAKLATDAASETSSAADREVNL